MGTTRSLELVRVWEFDQALRRNVGSLLCGVDEAGRGPLAGPVVAAAVILPEHVSPGTYYDSKRLSKKARVEAFQQAMAEAIAIGVGVVDHYFIDQYNILQATLLAMRKAILELKIDPNLVIVDGAAIPDLPYPQRKVNHGDALSQSIGAASIIAKVVRDNLMQNYAKWYPEYGFSRHMGYGTKEHLLALQQHGPSPIHRLTFAPIRDMVGDADTKTKSFIDRRKRVGQDGESIAISYLEGLGYVCLERNWRVRLGEVDAVMKDGETLVIVEVRSRRHDSEALSFQLSAESISESKRKRLRMLAQWYGQYIADVDVDHVRVDVVLVHYPISGEEPKLVHYPGIL